MVSVTRVKSRPSGDFVQKMKGGFRTCSKFLDRPETPNKASRVIKVGNPTNLSSILASVNRVASFCDFACVCPILQLSNPTYFQSFVKTTTF